jgi:hypothetical protein
MIESFRKLFKETSKSTADATIDLFPVDNQAQINIKQWDVNTLHELFEIKKNQEANALNEQLVKLFDFYNQASNAHHSEKRKIALERMDMIVWLRQQHFGEISL